MNDAYSVTRLVQQPGGKQCIGCHETELVAERVRAIKASLAPGLGFNRAQNDGSRVARAFERTFQIRHGEIHVIRIWRGVPGIAIRAGIKTRKNDAAAPEVMTSGRNSRSARIEQRPIKLRGSLDIAHWKNHSVQSNHGTCPPF